MLHPQPRHVKTTLEIKKFNFQTKELLEESRSKPKRHLWLKNVCPNFKSLEKMNNDIMVLKNRQTMPRTWKDFNKNTMYWE